MRRSIAVALAVAGLAGCGGPTYTTGEVEGIVTARGKPLSQALVEFHPDGQQGPSSRAETDDAGRFTLTYSLPNSTDVSAGALVGSHKVLVLDLKAATDPGAGRPRFATKYMQLASTPLTQKVEPGKQSVTIEVE